MSDKKFERLAYFLPNTFTAMNVGCGFMAILFSMQGQYYKACMFIMLGSIFDMVDGRVARLTGTQSSFGEQFDSMSDLISFGAAPAIIFYNKFLSTLGRAGMVIAFFYLLCGALRLARFNANISKVSSDYFQGLPIPGAAIAVLSYVLVSLEYEIFNNKYFAAFYIAFYGALMISNVPFTSFKKAGWVSKHKKKLLLSIFVIISSLFIYEEVMIPVIISAYVLMSLFNMIINRKKFKGIFDWDEE
ncbi:MAG: CDP-diacylglycerol--serine O-phosphatidyltransferase [Bacteriovoracaceae bacterium]|nr:CDP-diacylglycerol--serine O-phosphatidyltransferase [Bacteriovoracaceae bacterium]